MDALLTGGTEGRLQSLRIRSVDGSVGVTDVERLMAFESLAVNSVPDGNILPGDQSVEVDFEFANGATYTDRNAMLDCEGKRLLLWVDLLQPDADTYTHEISLANEPQLWSAIFTPLCVAWRWQPQRGGEAAIAGWRTSD